MRRLKTASAHKTGRNNAGSLPESKNHLSYVSYAPAQRCSIIN